MKKLTIGLFLCLMITTFTTPQTLEADTESVSQSDLNQIKCLADNIYHEARGEVDTGKIAVGLVTMNRVEAKGFANSVCGVVYEKMGSICQFSWVCRKLKIDRKTFNYQHIYKLAENTYLNYSEMDDFTNRSLFYHSDAVNPGWRLKKTVKVGRHIFYKRRN